MAIDRHANALGEQARGLLRLAQDDRPLAELEFNRLAFDEQLALVGQVQGRQKKDMLFLGRDCGRLVRALPADELYLTVKACSDEEIALLLELGTSGQLNYLLDIECWREDRLDRQQFEKWVRILLELDDDEAGPAIATIDPHFMAAGLKPRIEQFNVSRAELLLADDMGIPYFFTPADLQCRDGLTEHFVNLLYVVDGACFGRLCRLMLLHENPERAALAARNERLAARDVPSYAEARRVYRQESAPPAPPAAAEPAEPRALPEAAPDAQPFLQRGLKLLLRTDPFAREVADALGKQLVHLSNMVSVADGAEMGAEARRDAVAKVSAYVSLGLETMAHGDVELAAALLRGGRLLRLFRIGHTLGGKLAGRALAIWHDPRLWIAGDTVTCLDPQERYVLQMAREEPPRRELADGATRMVQSLRDLRAVERALDDIVAVTEMCCRLLPMPFPRVAAMPAETRHPGDIGMVHLGMVALANAENALAGRPPEAFALMTVDERLALAGHCIEGTRLADHALERAASWLDRLLASRGCAAATRAAGQRFLRRQAEAWQSDLLYLLGARQRGLVPRASRLSTLTAVTGRDR